MTHLQIVPLDIAVMLKEEGFDWEELYYDQEGKLIDFAGYFALGHTIDLSEYIPAPTVALALKWLRDVKGIVVEITSEGAGWIINVVHISKEYYENGNYESAELAGLRKALEYLKNKK